MRPLLIFGAVMILAGCAHGTRIEVVCLPMTEYSDADQSAAASELEAMADGSVVVRFVVDYGVMRSANRACLAGR